MNCYRVYSKPLNWNLAKTSCESIGSNLVSILSVYDQAFVDIITADFSTPVWIGLADQGVKQFSPSFALYSLCGSLYVLIIIFVLKMKYSITINV